MSDNISIDQVIAILNEAVAADAKAITNLIDHRVPCNRELADHPSIQVGWFPKDGSAPPPGSANVEREGYELRMGLLGLINGFFGVREDGWGYISAIYDKPGGVIVKFERTNPVVFRQA